MIDVLKEGTSADLLMQVTAVTANGDVTVALTESGDLYYWGVTSQLVIPQYEGEVNNGLANDKEKEWNPTPRSRL